MGMNSRQNLIIIKGRELTDQITHIERAGGRIAVTYTGGKTYHYGSDNVEWLSNPERIPTGQCRVFVQGDLLSDVDEVLHFGKWVKIFRKSGAPRCCLFSELSVEPVTPSNGRSRNVLAYFRELAEGSALRTDDDQSLIAMKYQHLKSGSSRTILSGFLEARLPASKRSLPPELVFPFGCNMSQKMAVQRAIQHPVSIIQGPPGTGKTQTILNLIANLLLQNKRVAVVSNNNSATANVLEKLQKHELDFVAAFLGSNENKEAFIEAQSDEMIELPTLRPDRETSVQKEILLLNNQLDEAFVRQNELAVIMQQLAALRLEMAHFEQFYEETRSRNLKVTDRAFQPKSSAKKLLKAWHICEEEARRGPKASGPLPSASDGVSGNRSILEKIRLLFRLGLAGRALFGLSVEERIPLLQKAYYQRAIADMEARRKTLEASLAGFRFEERLERLTELSVQLLKHRLAARYNNRARKRFSLDDLWRAPKAFLDEYPVILSTTFSVITSLKSGYLFDCVIVDEASQVDLLSGVLAMGVARKLVVVGDPMQLPNVLTAQDIERASEVALQYEVPEHCRFERHSLLSAVRAAFPGVPETLLREHYRCHPKIIQFCNQKFYRGELLVMTCDRGEPEVLKATVTVEGRHARGAFNQRQIDEITQQVLPELRSVKPDDIGIVSPFRKQADRMQSAVGSEEIEVDTVHKFQGREKRVIVISTVANDANEFVDNPNLLNVAVSRAQERLWLVVSKEMAEGSGNVADLVRYIRYNNGEVLPGKVRSVFDLLYRDYAAVRREALKKGKRVSRYDSENLVHGVIEAVLQEKQGLGVVSQLPLSMLVRNTDGLTAEEAAYATHPWTHADFVIYRNIDKSPVLAVEVDGYAFHREGSRQAERDLIKDTVLAKCGLPILRLSTVGSDERNRIKRKLDEVMA
ncbi:MAG: AAA family ATPase [Chlorobaculum sp.]|nr:AAA family ATPase [Chlorobaculum sp.]